MDRTTFEALRDLKEKRIERDIAFVLRRPTAPLLTTDDIQILNGNGVDLRLSITHISEVGSTTFNVHVPGTGPICRLDVDGPAHRPCGRSHKHSLQTERCPDRNLPDDVIDRPDLSRKSIPDLFREFCRMASITHVGGFDAP
ncbi:MAG: hypothetical protein ABSF69_11345 [Polyangiaceae bacterium]